MTDTEWDTKVRNIYRTVIADSDPDEGTTKAEAKLIARRRIRDLVDAGRLEVPIDLAITTSIDRADTHDGGIADRVITKMLRGEEALPVDGDPDLDLVVVLGRGRRKPLRHINRDDLLAMDRLRYKNMRAAASAYDEWRDVYEHALVALLDHGTFGEAAAAGAFGHLDAA